MTGAALVKQAWAHEGTAVVATAPQSGAAELQVGLPPPLPPLPPVGDPLPPEPVEPPELPELPEPPEPEGLPDAQVPGARVGEALAQAQTELAPVMTAWSEAAGQAVATHGTRSWVKLD